MANSPDKICYLWTSAELRAPEVGAIRIGSLVTGTLAEVMENLKKKATATGIKNPKMIADLIFSEGKISEFGSQGQPYPISPSEWESFAADVPEYGGDNIPIVYMVDGDRYPAGI